FAKDKERPFLEDHLYARAILGSDRSEPANEVLIRVARMKRYKGIVLATIVSSLPARLHLVGLASAGRPVQDHVVGNALDGDDTCAFGIVIALRLLRCRP